MANLEFKELNAQELEEVNGGFSILKFVGFLDGVKGNEEIYIFGIRVY